MNALDKFNVGDRVTTTARTMQGEAGEVRLITADEVLIHFDRGDADWVPVEEVGHER